MKILLTGGSGFIGKNIYEQLGEKHDITAPSHKEVDFKNYDAVKEILKGGGFDAIIHSATKPAHRAAEDLNDVVMTNLLMFTTLCKCAADYDIKKFIFYGSGAEYNNKFSLSNVKEDRLGQSIPLDITGFPKYLMNYISDSKIKIINLRCFGVFGKYEDYSIRFISNAICRALSGYSITLRQDRVFSYLYIDDLVELTDYFLQGNFKYNNYNITPDEKWSLLDIARIVRRIASKDVPIDVANNGKGLEYTGCNDRLKSELSYAFTPLYDAVKMLLDWYVLNFDTVDKEKILYNK